MGFGCVCEGGGGDVGMQCSQWINYMYVSAPRECMKELLPAGSLAHGQVFSHFVGYLQYILPGNVI